jgi:hypothetical protein
VRAKSVSKCKINFYFTVKCFVHICMSVQSLSGEGQSIIIVQTKPLHCGVVYLYVCLCVCLSVGALSCESQISI